MVRWPVVWVEREGRGMTSEIESESRPAVAEPVEASPLRILAVTLRARRLVIACAGVGLAIAVTAALLKDRQYLTNFSFVPQTAQDPTRAGIASLAGQLGVSLGSSSSMVQPPQLYADLLVTREVLLPIVRDSVAAEPGGRGRVPLTEFFRIQDPEPEVAAAKALKTLRTRVITTAVAARTTGVVSVEVRTRSPQVSLAIAERLLEGVNRFNLVTRQSQAGEERRFTEQRLAAARAALRAAEDRLEAFLQANRRIADAPSLGFQRDRLQRDVSLQQEVVVGLAQHFEDARIREVRDTPVITVIERPTLAAQPEPGGRLLILLGGLVGGVAIGLVVALVRDGFRRMRQAGVDPAFNELLGEWRAIRATRT